MSAVTRLASPLGHLPITLMYDRVMSKAVEMIGRVFYLVEVLRVDHATDGDGGCRRRCALGDRGANACDGTEEDEEPNQPEQRYRICTSGWIVAPPASRHARIGSQSQEAAGSAAAKTAAPPLTDTPARSSTTGKPKPR